MRSRYTPALLVLLTIVAGTAHARVDQGTHVAALVGPDDLVAVCIFSIDLSTLNMEYEIWQNAEDATAIVFSSSIGEQVIETNPAAMTDGTYAADAAQLDDLVRSNFNVTIETSAYPDGEWSGHLVTGEKWFSSSMSASEAVPSESGGERGAMILYYNDTMVDTEPTLTAVTICEYAPNLDLYFAIGFDVLGSESDVIDSVWAYVGVDVRAVSYTGVAAEVFVGTSTTDPEPTVEDLSSGAYYTAVTQGYSSKQEMRGALEALTVYKDLGENCTTAADCIHGHCVDGVCCENTCDGVCVSCALPGMRGTCAPYGSGDPENECEATDSHTCQTTGACAVALTTSTSSSCRYHPAATACYGCFNDEVISGGLCDGVGGCAGSASYCSGNFTCAGESGGNCSTSCDSNSGCVDGNICVDSACQLIAPCSSSCASCDEVTGDCTSCFGNDELKNGQCSEVAASKDNEKKKSRVSTTAVAVTLSLAIVFVLLVCVGGSTVLLYVRRFYARNVTVAITGFAITNVVCDVLLLHWMSTKKDHVLAFYILLIALGAGTFFNVLFLSAIIIREGTNNAFMEWAYRASPARMVLVCVCTFLSACNVEVYGILSSKILKPSLNAPLSDSSQWIVSIGGIAATVVHNLPALLVQLAVLQSRTRERKDLPLILVLAFAITVIVFAFSVVRRFMVCFTPKKSRRRSSSAGMQDEWDGPSGSGGEAPFKFDTEMGSRRSSEARASRRGSTNKNGDGYDSDADTEYSTDEGSSSESGAKRKAAKAAAKKESKKGDTSDKKSESGKGRGGWRGKKKQPKVGASGDGGAGGGDGSGKGKESKKESGGKDEDKKKTSNSSSLLYSD